MVMKMSSLPISVTEANLNEASQQAGQAQEVYIVYSVQVYTQTGAQGREYRFLSHMLRWKDNSTRPVRGAGPTALCSLKHGDERKFPVSGPLGY